MDIEKQLKHPNIKKKLHEFHIQHLWLTWSVARNTATHESDIDIIYEESPEGIQQNWWYFRIVQYLEEKLWKKVDFIDKNYINKHIKSEILADMKKVW